MAEPLIVFGLIFLVMTLIAKHYMKKEAENPNCSEDVNDVKANWTLFKVLLPIEILMIVVGLVLLAI